jgi:cytochrome P450
MRDSWASANVVDLAQDARRVALNVLTAVAYGCPLDWTTSPPTTTPSSAIGPQEDFAELVTGLNSHLMSLFLMPNWWLRLAPSYTAAGQAQAAYTAFAGYLHGMLVAERERIANGESSENLLTALLDAQAHGDKDQRRMTDVEVLGNAFVFIFAGHETTANTLHYALLLLAAHPEVQAEVMSEIDALYKAAEQEGRELGYEDFGRARWITAVMNETLRVYTPTSMINKWTESPTPIPVDGRTYTLPANTRISISNIGVHRNPAVWGDNADDWHPSRWIASVAAPESPASPPKSLQTVLRTVGIAAITPPPTPQGRSSSLPTPVTTSSRHTPYRGLSSSTLSTPTDLFAPSPKLLSPEAAYFMSPIGSIVTTADTCSAKTQPWETLEVLKPPKGSFLAFSEGQRACTARKFASVEFMASLCALLRDQRVALGDGWDAARLKTMLRGRKAGALTLQPPEIVPMVFERR